MKEKPAIQGEPDVKTEMTDKEVDALELSDEEKAVLKLVPDDDRQGVIDRAAKSKVHVSELTLRDPKKEILDMTKQTQRDAEGILQRKRKEKKSVGELAIRQDDNKLGLFSAMFKLLESRGRFAVKGQVTDTNDPITNRFTDEERDELLADPEIQEAIEAFKEE